MDTTDKGDLSSAPPGNAHETCPYRGLPAPAYWSTSVAGRPAGDVDPIVGVPFKIGRSDRIATAGSCFAQHLSKRLKRAGYNYLTAENGYPRMGARLRAKFNYDTFSARYGNIYTARQLLQLAQRAYGTFRPKEPLWRNGAYWVDPFRPFIQPGGFETPREAECDIAQHLAAVRTLMETVDVFVFTLGLTEAWVCKSDGAVLPVCPGCGAGMFDAAQYEFHNFDVDEVVADFVAFAAQLRAVNAASRIVITVSPVPLVATFSGDHVLSATTYSKSVLRVAAGKIAKAVENCVYFPSYEIITGAFNRGQYVESDLRSVKDAGLEHVMRVFFNHFGDGEEAPARTADDAKTSSPPSSPAARSLLDVICEEYASLNPAALGD